MNKILKRDEYVTLMEQKEYEELMLINEGVLSKIKSLFGSVVNMFKTDWDSINCESTELKNIYKEMDDKLSGYTLMKLSKKGDCNKIRQELVDFAYSWYKMKMDAAKENNRNPLPAKSMKFKDETLKDNLKHCEDTIKDIADGDAQMQKWADTLKNNMKIVINNAILNEIEDDPDGKKELHNKKVIKVQKEMTDAIEAERNALFNEVKAKPISSDLLGDKAFQNLGNEYKKIINAKDDNERIKLFKNDTMFGFKEIFKKEDFSKTNEFKTTCKLLKIFYDTINDENSSDFIDKHKETPGVSVQAMLIAINSFIKNCIYGTQDNGYAKELPLMAKCAIVSNGIIGYNLPLIDPKDLDKGNTFTELINKFADESLSKGKVKLPDDFKRNAKTLINKIVDEAKKLKEKGEKEYNAKISSIE